MVESPLTDMTIQIKNGYLAGKKIVELPFSKVNQELAKIFLKEGYLANVEIKKTKLSPKKKSAEVKIIKVGLKYEGKKPVLEGAKIISKPSLKVYVKKGNIPYILGGRGLVVLSTPKGLMTGREARQKGLGGEIICEVW